MARVSLSSIASALGISAMTVSRALRGQPGVSADLTRKIVESAAQLGYRPDPEVGRLMYYLRHGRETGRHASLCGLTDQPRHTEPSYFNQIARQAAVRAQELGFAFSVIRIPPSQGGWARVIRSITTQGITGIVLLPFVVSTALPATGWDAYSVVSATSSITAPRFHEVVPNHAANARLLIEHLAAQGFRRIGLVEQEPHAERTREALPAAIAWHHSRARVRCAPLIYQPDETPDVVDWARRQRPDVVVVGRARHLPQFHAAFGRAGLNPPCVLGNSRGLCDLAPGLDERADLVGAAAIDALSSLVVRGERGIPAVPTSMAITGQWLEAAPGTLA